jgi:glycine/D-amino acid oxidase-like deaminating enzyme
VKKYDIAVIGCGSGGFGTALAASRKGLEVLVIEKSSSIGGNANRCGVNNWEPVAGATGFPREIYQRLRERPQAVGIYGYSRHFVWSGKQSFPGGEHTLRAAAGKSYSDTLRRHGAGSLAEDEEFIRSNIFGISFEPEAYEQELRDMLAETGCCTLRENTFLKCAVIDNGRIEQIILENGETVIADYYVDATGDGDLCDAAGCVMMEGQESRDTFNESAAPVDATDKVNGVSLIFRIRRRENPIIGKLPEGIGATCWWKNEYPFAAFFEFPNGDFNVNILPTMEGREYLDSDPSTAYAECRRRILSWWHYVQCEYPEFQSWEIASISRAVGVRESRRVRGDYILTQADCTAGTTEGVHNDIIAISDHQLDRHGDSSIHTEIRKPYGIPYRCLIPEGFANLLVACRAASFSSVAASSCRLSRTMMQLGQAAGTAIVIASENGVEDLRNINSTLLKDRLISQGVQLA